MVEKKSSKKTIRDITFRVLKASVKAVIVYAIYMFLVQFLAPISELVPGFLEMIEVFVIVYIVLMILGDLTARTIFQYFFGTARALFVIVYLLMSLGDGIISVGFENFTLMVDFTLILTIAVVLSLLGLSKSILQAINFMNERAESGSQP